MVIHAILCPVDFSDGSRMALRAAVRFARQFNARLDVVFVEDPLLAWAASLDLRSLPGLQEELKQFVADTPDLDLPGDPVLHVVSGSPAEQIVGLAEREHVDLIVVGTHGLAGVPSAYFGSTAARVLKRTTIPVLMVPVSDGADKARDLEGLGSILVLCDFGRAAARAARAAARFAEMIGARLVLLHVVPSVSAPASWSARAREVVRHRIAEAHQRICGAMTPLEKHGPVESVIVQGNIARCVAETAKMHHAGLILVGLEGDAGASQPGSTAYAVICSAEVPVLALPATGAETDADDAAGRRQRESARVLT